MSNKKQNKSPNSKYSYFGVILNGKKESPNLVQELEQLQDLLLSKFDLVATIIHDKWSKWEVEQGERLRPHIHAYIEPNAKYTENQFLDYLEEVLGIARERITIEGSNNDFLLCQYLIHKNDSNKAQFSVDLVKTTNAEFLAAKMAQKYQTKEEKFRDLLLDITQCKSILDLAKVQGVETANKYRSLFNQIKSEQKVDLESLIKELNRYQKFVDSIKAYLGEYDFISENDQVLKAEIKRLLILNGF